MERAMTLPWISMYVNTAIPHIYQSLYLSHRIFFEFTVISINFFLKMCDSKKFNAANQYIYNQ